MITSVLVNDKVDLCDCLEILLDEDFLDDIVGSKKVAAVTM
jgi:hypothetical protein